MFYYDYEEFYTEIYRTSGLVQSFNLFIYFQF